MAKKYRKKQIVIEAIRVKFGYTNIKDIKDFVQDPFIYNDHDKAPYIKTLAGNMVISDGDYIIKGIQGEFYPCKADIFEASYEELNSNLYVEVSVKDLDFVKLLGEFIKQIELGDYKDRIGHDLKMNKAYQDLLEGFKLERSI